MDATARVHRERLLMGANQSGKTLTGGAEASLHLPGHYDEWERRTGVRWPGKRFTKPTRGWVGSDGFEAVRDGAQRILVGEPKIESEWGTRRHDQAQR